MSAAQAPRPFSEPSPLVRWLAGAVVVLYAIVTILPLLLIVDLLLGLMPDIGHIPF